MRSYRSPGYSLIELMFVILVIGIVAAIAIPAYTRYITKSRRVSAEACLATYATYLERFYTTNLSYAADSGGNALDNTALAALAMPCAKAQTGTGQYYSYSFAATSTQSTYQLQAMPIGSQASADARCGALGIDQAGTRSVSGNSPVSACWPQ
jgi:type IV pilus assembly protein PilE